MCRTNPDEYRFRCPEGHVTIRRINPYKSKQSARGSTDTPSYYCNTCKQRYEGKPIDMLEVSE